VKSHLQVGQLVDYREDLLNLRAAFKLKLSEFAGGGANQATAAEG
jgi:hypothetical protein